MSKNLYIFGNDCNSRFLAAQFASRKSKQLRPSLLFDKDTTLKHYFQSGSTITYDNMLDKRNPIRCKYKMESGIRPSLTRTKQDFEHANESQYIDNLIIADRRLQNPNVLDQYQTFINSDTNILFVNPSIGVTRRIMHHLYGKDDKLYPHLYQAISSHILQNGPGFTVKHLGIGDFWISSCKGEESFNDIFDRQELSFPDEKKVPGLIKEMLQLPMLRALYFPYKNVYILQLERVIYDCCVLPLTSFLNSDLRKITLSDSIESMLQSIVEECLDVIKNLNGFKILQKKDPTINAIFNKDRMMSVILEMVKNTQSALTTPDYHRSVSRFDPIQGDSITPSLSQMQVDDFHDANGYIVKLGAEQGISTPVNKTLLNLMIGAKVSTKDSEDIVL